MATFVMVCEAEKLHPREMQPQSELSKVAPQGRFPLGFSTIFSTIEHPGRPQVAPRSPFCPKKSVNSRIYLLDLDLDLIDSHI